MSISGAGLELKEIRIFIEAGGDPCRPDRHNFTVHANKQVLFPGTGKNSFKSLRDEGAISCCRHRHRSSAMHGLILHG